MKRLLFFLLGLAVVTSASAGIDRSQLAEVSINQKVAKTLIKQDAKRNVEVVKTESGAKTIKDIKKFNMNIPGVQLRAPHRAASDVISDQPEGELKSYSRSGSYAAPDDDETDYFYYSGNLSGSTDIVFAEDGVTVYIKNIVWGYTFDTWVQGTISGNKITVPLGQYVTWNDENSFGVIVGWGTASEEYFAYNSSVTEATFTIDGNTISLDNSSVDMSGKEMTGLCYVPDIYTSYLYVINGNVAFTLKEDSSEPTLITTEDILAMYDEGGYILGFDRSGKYNYNGTTIGDQSGTGYFYIDANFENVYMMNPVYGRQTNNWVKGAFNENGDIVVPLGQYMSWNSSYEYGLVTAWGTYGDGAFTADPSVTECTYTFAQDADGYLYIALENSSENTGLAYIWSDDQTWANYVDWYTVYYQMTGDPEILSVTPTSTSAEVIWSNENEDLHWNLRYKVVDENAPFVCGFDSAEEFDAWDLYDEDGDGYEWGFFDGEDYKCASSESFHNNESGSGGTALTPDNWLVSPEVKLTGKLKFKYWGVDEDWAAEKFTVYVSTDYNGLDISSFTAISEEITATGDVTEMEIDLSAYNGQVGRIAFRHTNVTDEFRLAIDDVLVGDPDYVFPDWIVVENLADAAYTIEGLTPETTYEVQVQSYNAGYESDWTASTYFTTIADVYILGEVNNQTWAANAGTQMAYDAENQVYTATVTLDGRGQSGENYFSFSTVLAENNDDGGWAYIKPFRFGAVTDENNSDFWYDDMYDGQTLSLAYGGDKDPAAFRVMAGEYELTLSLENMTLIIHKVSGPEPEVLRGDVNRDGSVTIGDVTDLIDHLLSSDLEEGEHFSPDNANTNLDESISIGDVTALIDFLLSGAWPE